MRLVLIISCKNRTVRLVNVDAKNSATALERDIDCWSCPNGNSLRATYWRNAQRSDLNPYQYNRVNIHYNKIDDYQRVTTSYYCIDKIIYMEDMTIENFDSSNIE